MATERQEPDVLITSSALSGNVASLQDDPDSYDTDWMVASSNNDATNVYVSFPTPTGDPTVGADLQEFRVAVRKTATSGTGTPTAQLVLWENGSLVRSVTAVNVTSTTGQVISMTWNANELTTASGANVELKVICTKSGGSPSARAAVDIGAVEWNVDYTAGVPFPSVSVTPSASTLVTGKVDPSAEQSSITLTPTQSTLVTGKVDPSVTIVGTDVVVEPLPATLVASKTDPTFEYGDATIVPVAASSITNNVDPTFEYGSATVTPAQATSVTGKVDPSVNVAGGNEIVTPVAATLVTGKVDPSFEYGSATVTPAQSTLVASNVDPLFVYGDLAITPSQASIVTDKTDPSFEYGSATVTPVTISSRVLVAQPTVINSGDAAVVRKPWRVRLSGSKLGVFNADSPISRYHSNNTTDN